MTDTPFAADDSFEGSVEPPESALDSGRYGHLSLDDGVVVIYDREDPGTWLQSDFAVEVGG